MTNELKEEVKAVALRPLADAFQKMARNIDSGEYEVPTTIEEAEKITEKLINESWERIEPLINQKEKELLEKVEALDCLREQNTHWSACNNHGKGRPNYKCVCPVEPQNELRSELRDRIKQLKEELKGGTQDE